ncbi:alpha/beta fold hydrolase [Vibrio sonorensis]|uniref:alpha/beta fold hydrolase n=1 Tax=Vibrio sonorensis TaxID=1004316 RepID=UPI001FDEC6EA|nr:hypothetical protein [Vibrio sonorensis]
MGCRLESSSPQGIYRNAKSLIEGRTPSWREVYYGFTAPKTYVFGEFTLPDPDYDELAKHGVKVETISNAGHSMAWENPQQLASVIKRSIES